jgi:hypothetical protein
MTLERLLDDGALDAAAAAMDQPELAEAALVRGAHVLVDHRWNVARREGVQIELRLNRDFVHVVVIRPFSH